MTPADPLKALVIDTDSIVRKEVATALAPVVQFDGDGGIWLLGAFNGLGAEDKVVTLLLAVKAQQLLGLRENDGVTPQELSELGQMSGGTIRPKLGKLLKAREIAKSENRYHLPPPAIRRAVARLEKATENG
jgi:hypothetical protein